ncbi:MAG: glycosyltransferase [Planctomycetota bacterium]
MKYSVVIPTKNPGLPFVDVLEAVRSQQVDGDLEIVVVDSGSKDGTRERAEHYGAVYWEIPPQNFNHGRTRNLGIQVATGELVALLTQDAEPRDPTWLATLGQALRDVRVAGAYGRVVPRPDATPLVERTVKADLVYSEEPLLKTIDDPGGWERIDPFQRRVHGHFNNVASCVRRSVAERIPFPALDFGEDLAWGVQVMKEGYALIYEPRAVVVHSHRSSLLKDFLRYRADAELMRRLFGLRNRTGPIDAARAFSSEVRKDLSWLREHPPSARIRYGLYSFPLRAAQILGQCAGSVGRKGW